MSDWPSAVIFDFDGVIMNSEPLHFRAFQGVLAGEGIALSEDEYYAELIGFDDRGAFRQVLTKHGRRAVDSVLARLMSAKSRRMHEVIRAGEAQTLPGVSEFVRGLREYPLAICSGALRAEIELMLEGVGLRACFPIIVAADDVLIGKPDPSGYLQTLGLIGRRAGREIAPGDALVIEDAPIVIESVRRAGFKVLGVATTCALEELHQAHFAVRSLHRSEVLAKIPQLRLV